MAVNGCTVLCITVAVLAVIVGVEAGHFRYTPKDAHDPENVSLVRMALTANGINPDGISLMTFYKNDWGLGRSYKATYVDRRGRLCHVHFRDEKVGGLKPKGTPTCDSREIGVGNCDGCGGGDFGEIKTNIKIKVLED